MHVGCGPGRSGDGSGRGQVTGHQRADDAGAASGHDVLRLLALFHGGGQVALQA